MAKQSQQSCDELNKAQLSIYVANKTEQGYITPQSLTNGLTGNPTKSGNPPLQPGNIKPDGLSYIMLNVIGGCYRYDSEYGYEIVNSPTTGTALFNLPNGSTWTIEWNIDPNDSSKCYVTFTPEDDTYSFQGVNSPSSTMDCHYQYDVVVALG